MTVKTASSDKTDNTKHTGQRILVVDDSSFFRQLLDDILTEAGYQVECVNSGSAALASMANQPPDLLVADLIMPGMDGFELIERVRNSDDTAELPIIVVTEILATDHAMERLRQLNCGGFINKFAPPDHVLFRVRDALFPADVNTRSRGRLAISLAIQYEMGNESFFGYSYTISARGLFIRRVDPPEAGEHITLSFNLPGRENAISATGTVVRAQQRSQGGRAPSGFAVCFEEIAREDERALEEFICHTVRAGI